MNAADDRQELALREIALEPGVLVGRELVEPRQAVDLAPLLVEERDALVGRREREAAHRHDADERAAVDELEHDTAERIVAQMQPRGAHALTSVGSTCSPPVWRSMRACAS